MRSLSDKSGFFGEFRLKASNLQFSRGFTTLFDDLNFEIATGDSLHVLGANGSGKTSLLRIVAGLTRPDSGNVSFNGIDIQDDYVRFTGNVCYMGHRPALNDALTPAENLRYLASLDRSAPCLNVEDCLTMFDLEQTAHLPCFSLSAGQKQRVSLARIMRSQTRFWILDEPATSLDSSGIELLTSAMQSHLNAGGTVIYTSHQTLKLESRKQRQLSL